MNQYQWTFLDNKRQRHTLGIAHGPTSGHLVVHCDHRVVIIEFSVLESKEFSFFVEDELCRLNVIGDEATGFTYNFAIDQDANTEVNRVRNANRKRSARRNLVRSVLLFLAPVAILGALFGWGYSSYLQRLPQELLVKGVRAQATRVATGEFEFVGGAEVVRGQPLGKDPERLAVLGLKGSESVPVLFRDGDAARFVIDWRRVVKPLPRDSTRSRVFAQALYAYLDDRLPPVAGTPVCALRTADKLAGKLAAVGVIDAYALDDPTELERWGARFREPAYQARLRRVCPSPDVLPSAPNR